MPHNQQCHEGHEVRLESGSGYISSISSSGAQSACNWILKAKPGQQFNFTILDFGILQLVNEKLPEAQAYCHRYAILKDGKLAEGQRDVTICAGRERYSHVYLSKSHEVQLQVFRSEESSARFLLKYEGEW